MCNSNYVLIPQAALMLQVPIRSCVCTSGTEPLRAASSSSSVNLMCVDALDA